MNSSELLELLEKSNSTELELEFETPSFIQEHERRRPLMISVYSTLIAVATIGNVAVIYNLIRIKRLKGRLTGVDKLVLNLAIADLFVAFFTLPILIVPTANPSWELGNLLCKVAGFLYPFGVYLSGFTVACISIERYVAFSSSAVNSQKGEHRVKIMIASAWICATIASFPQVLIYCVYEASPNLKHCTRGGAFSSEGLATAYLMTGFFLNHVVPLVTIVTCYSAILARLRRLEQEATFCSTALVTRLKSNVFRMSLVISLTFFFCWAPYSCVLLWGLIDGASMRELLPLNTILVLISFAYANACANPIVYGFFQLRKRHERCNDSEEDQGAGQTVVWSELNVHET